MPIPSFTDTFGGALGPGITIIQDGDVFDNDKEVTKLDLDKMNEELARTAKGSGVFFMPPEAPKEDMPFRQFLKTLKK